MTVNLEDLMRQADARYEAAAAELARVVRNHFREYQRLEEQINTIVWHAFARTVASIESRGPIRAISLGYKYTAEILAHCPNYNALRHNSTVFISMQLRDGETVIGADNPIMEQALDPLKHSILEYPDMKRFMRDYRVAGLVINRGERRLQSQWTSPKSA